MPPTDRDTIDALRTIAGALDVSCAYWRSGRFWFLVSERWSLSVSPDSAGRFRLAACYGTTEAATLWASAHDRRRLADLALSLRAETDALTA